MPFDTSVFLAKRYHDYITGGHEESSRNSGTDEYIFDFSTMAQTNVKTGKVRKIRCRLDVPRFWRIQSIQDMAIGRDAARITLNVLKNSEAIGLGGMYTESQCHVVNEKPLWWKEDGSKFF